MSDLEQAVELLKLAERDFRALKGMTDPEVFAEEIFGFVAQQAVEKSFKAWLALLGATYPFTHDLTDRSAGWRITARTHRASGTLPTSTPLQWNSDMEALSLMICLSTDRL